MAIPCASPLRGERQANLREKNGKTSRFGRKKRAGATAFSLRVFSECRQAYPHHLPPFPAGRVFTGAACGGGSPMRKGVCYAMLYYAMLFYAMLCVPKYTFSAFMADFCNI